MLDFVEDGAAIAFVPKRRARVREREEDSLFERSEVFSQVVYIVYNCGSRCKCVPSNAVLSAVPSAVLSNKRDPHDFDI